MSVFPLGAVETCVPSSACVNCVVVRGLAPSFLPIGAILLQSFCVCDTNVYVCLLLLFLFMILRRFSCF